MKAFPGLANVNGISAAQAQISEDIYRVLVKK
jgi:hypothetical protein